MTYRQIAELIPQSYRTEMVDTNMISAAIATTSDKNMNYLAVIWQNYVEPDISLTCNMCMAALLDKYRNLQDTLAAMEKERKLLDALN